MKKFCFPVILKLILPALAGMFWAGAYGQTLNGMSTGNYAGIAGLNFNPASIVDSRFKFDLNLAGGQYYFNNNFLLAKPLIFAKRMLHKEPYNSSYESVKNELLVPVTPSPTGTVSARQNAEFQLPLSFMLTTSKRSAIAVNLRNRYELILDNLNPQTASLFYNELNDNALLGKTMNNDGFQSNFMNWQEFGFTYGRVLMNANKHFFKAAFTAKWLGGNAAAFIQADQLSVTFKDPSTVSLSSPRIQYARTVRADFDLFTRREMFSNLEDQSFGWDAGIVYEFRGRIGNFKYTDEDYTGRLRRDKNKYTLRLGLAINDIGRLEFNRLPLTRNHSAGISNWNFSQVKASNLRDWDTAYSKMVDYLPGEDTSFSVRLPSGFIANADLHLFSGFYVNAAIQRRIENLGKKATTSLFTAEWFAITPRFEGRFFGIYVPVLMRNNTTQIGTTLRFGPLYLGSNNLLALVQNPMVPSADVHAGLRIPIGFGKPTKLAKAIEKSSGLQLSEAYEKELDSTQMKQNALEQRVAFLEKLTDSSFRNPTPVVINNYIITDSSGKQVIQSQVSQSRQDNNGRSATQTGNNTYTQAQADSMNAEIEKMRKEVQAQMKKEGVEPPKDPARKKRKNGKTPEPGSRAGKKAEKAEKRYRKETEQYNKAVEEELRKMRRQQAYSSTAVVGALSANAIVEANSNKGTGQVTKDTIVVEKVTRDTIIIRDTVRVPAIPDTAGKTPDPAPPAISASAVQVPELRTARIYFASGSAAIGKNFTGVLNNAAAWMLKNPGKKVLLSGVTDATGSAEINKALAQKRIDAVKKALESRGINPARFEQEILLSTGKAKVGSASSRRVDMKAIQ